MRYLIKPKDRIYVKSYGFFLLLKILVNIWAMSMVKKVLDNAKKSTTDAIKNASKRAIQKTAEATGDLMNKKYQKKDIYLIKISIIYK